MVLLAVASHDAWWLRAAAALLALAAAVRLVNALRRGT
jgi:hypothetical protein